MDPDNLPNRRRGYDSDCKQPCRNPWKEKGATCCDGGLLYRGHDWRLFGQFVQLYRCQRAARSRHVDVPNSIWHNQRAVSEKQAGYRSRHYYLNVCKRSYNRTNYRSSNFSRVRLEDDFYFNHTYYCASSLLGLEIYKDRSHSF